MTLSGSAVVSSVFGQHLPGLPTGLNVGPEGNLYFLSRNNNALYKIIYTTDSAPTITGQPKNTTVAQGAATQLSITTTGSAPLVYQWQKNGINIAGATSATYPINQATLADSGRYAVVVSNTVGSVTSQTATISVTIPNALPTVTITTPISHTLYRAGEVMPFSGTAVDAEDGTLPASAFVWTVEFYHHTHLHDGPPIAVGVRNGQFTIPNQGETAADVFYRFVLTVTDSRGGIGRDSVDVDPSLVTVNVISNRAGLQLALNGPPITTPYSQTFVSGLKLSLSAPASQTLNGVTYDFIRWQNGSDVTNMITVPDTSITYAATYGVQPCPIPNSLTTSAITDQSARLHWQVAGYTDETRYAIRWRPTGAVSWTNVTNLTAINGVGTYSLTGLTSTSPYEWQVKTVCWPTDSSGFSVSALFQTFSTCTTLKNGSWNDLTVWSCNRIPTETDVVHLRHNLEIPPDHVAHAQHVYYDLPVLLTWAIGARLLLNQ